jgi:hypothetical protein
MANITLENGTDGLFDLLNQIFELQTQSDACVISRRSEWNTVSAAIGAEFSAASWTAAVSAAESAVGSEESAASSTVFALQALAGECLVRKVDEAVNLVSKTLDAALVELCSQMNERNQSLKLPAVAITVTADGGNTGDMVIVASKKGTNGKDSAAILAETVDVTVSGSGSSLLVSAAGDAVSSGLSPDSFGGSGLSAYMSYFSTSTGLTGSTGLYSFTTSSGTLPGSWIANVGTLGTAVLSGQPQVSTITIAGTPTSGTYRITCATSSLGTQSTGNLAFDSTAAQIQGALAAMSGFSRVSVTGSGTGPNYTHTITFYGMAESVTVNTVSSLNTGTLTVATPTAYATPSLGSSPIVLVSDGSTLVSASHLMTHLQASTTYAVNAWLALNTTAASGVIEFSLTNGVGGTILQDDAGTDLKFTVNATALTTAYKAAAANIAAGAAIWNLPKTLPASVYLRIRASTTLPNTRQLFIENVVIAPATRLYTGGPFVAMFAGPTGPKDGDTWTIATTNDYAGNVSWAMERNFGLRERGLSVPHLASSYSITEFTRFTGSI